MTEDRIVELESKINELESKINELDKFVKEVLTNHANSINTCLFNVDAIYELLFALAKYPMLVIEKDENGNIIDVDLKMPKIDQEFLYEFTDYVFDIKHNTKNSEVITAEEVNKLCENKIKEMLSR